MNVCIVCLDALRDDHITPEIMPGLSTLLATGRRYTNVWAKRGWTGTSVAAMMMGDDDAFEKGAAAFIGQPSLGGRFNRTHATSAFLANATILLDECKWVFDDFNHIWTLRAVESVHYGCNASHPFSAWVDWKAEQAGSWLSYIHFIEPHEPYTADIGDPPLPEGNLFDHLKQGYFTPIMERAEGQLLLPEEALKYLRRKYRATCAKLDADFVRLDRWKRILDGETYLVFVTDHGDGHYEDGIWGHGREDCYQVDGVRKLCWGVVGPGIEPEIVTDEMSNSALPDIVADLMQRDADRSHVDWRKWDQKLRELGYI